MKAMLTAEAALFDARSLSLAPQSYQPSPTGRRKFVNLRGNSAEPPEYRRPCTYNPYFLQWNARRRLGWSLQSDDTALVRAAVVWSDGRQAPVSK